MADITIAASGNAPAIAAFRNIQFVAAFTDGSSSTINALPLSAGGAAAGGTFRVNAPTDVNPTRQWPAIAEFFGGFAIAWIERGPNLGPNVKLRVFDGDTFAPGDEIQVNATPVDSNQPPALARLSDGGFVLVWADARPDERIRAQRFDRLGNRNGADFRANTVAGLHRRPMVAVLANGSIVIGWLARVTGPLQVRFQIFDASATPVGGERLLDGGASLASVTALDSGRFVIAHVRHPADGETLPQVIAEVNVFEPTGAASGSAIPVTNEQAIMSSWPTLAPLPGGRFPRGVDARAYVRRRLRAGRQREDFLRHTRCARSNNSPQQQHRRNTFQRMRRGRVGHRERRERFGRLGEQRQRFAGDCGFRNGVPGPWVRIPVSGAAARGDLAGKHFTAPP